MWPKLYHRPEMISPYSQGDPGVAVRRIHKSAIALG